MREPQDKEIDGTVYTIRPLAGMKSVTFLPRLNKILGPAIASLIDAKGVTGENLKQALTALGDRLDEKEMEVITKTLLGDCTSNRETGIRVDSSSQYSISCSRGNPRRPSSCSRSPWRLTIPVFFPYWVSSPRTAR